MSETTVAGWPPAAPAPPWCRLVGRVIGPDADPHTVHAQVVIDPDAERPTVVLPDGAALVASRVVCSTDDGGWLVGPTGERWVDVIAPGEGVTPTGEWTTTVRVTVPGVSGDRWVRHVALTQGAVVDLAELAPQASYVGDAVTVAEQSAQAAASSAQAAADALARAEADIAAGLTVGPPGVGVSSITDEDGDGTATVTLTDGSTSDLILPRGPQGVGVSSITNADGDTTALVTLTDGSTADLPLPTVTPPSLSIGSVTTVPAGGAATASVTGTYPDLRLNFGLVTGQPDDYRIVGVGRPDVSGSMSTAIAARVAAAPPGSTFTSTDGAGVGAWAWVRRTDKWAVTHCFAVRQIGNSVAGGATYHDDSTPFASDLRITYKPGFAIVTIGRESSIADGRYVIIPGLKELASAGLVLNAYAAMPLGGITEYFGNICIKGPAGGHLDIRNAHQWILPIDSLPVSYPGAKIL